MQVERVDLQHIQSRSRATVLVSAPAGKPRGKLFFRAYFCLRPSLQSPPKFPASAGCGVFSALSRIIPHTPDFRRLLIDIFTRVPTTPPRLFRPFLWPFALFPTFPRCNYLFQQSLSITLRHKLVTLLFRIRVLLLCGFVFLILVSVVKRALFLFSGFPPLGFCLLLSFSVFFSLVSLFLFCLLFLLFPVFVFLDFPLSSPFSLFPVFCPSPLMKYC